MLRDMQLIVFSISHATVMPSSAKIRPVVQHMPASTPTFVHWQDIYWIMQGIWVQMHGIDDCLWPAVAMAPLTL